MNQSDMILVDDEIDFSIFEAEPEAVQRVKPVSDYTDAVIAHFLLPDEQRGTYLPWDSLASKFRVRRSELTVWPGISGHGKSILLTQVMLAAADQGERAVIASMEMRPVQTISRMVRQATGKSNPGPRDVRAFADWAAGKLWIYDHLGAVQWHKLLAVLRYCAVELKASQFVIDSLMRCGIAEGDYDGQKAFVDALCTFKSDYNAGAHLVMHARKREDEHTAPGKFDAKGTGTITDLCDNVMTVWRNKKKEAQVHAAQTRGDYIPDDVRSQPDALLICDKQRNFDWEGRAQLWYDRPSQSFVDMQGGVPRQIIGEQSRIPGEDDE